MLVLATELGESANSLVDPLVAVDLDAATSWWSCSGSGNNGVDLHLGHISIITEKLLLEGEWWDLGGGWKRYRLLSYLSLVIRIRTTTTKTGTAGLIERESLDDLGMSVISTRFLCFQTHTGRNHLLLSTVLTLSGTSQLKRWKNDHSLGTLGCWDSAVVGVIEFISGNESGICTVLATNTIGVSELQLILRWPDGTRLNHREWDGLVASEEGSASLAVDRIGER
jgi:hypothetical protein